MTLLKQGLHNFVPIEMPLHIKSFETTGNIFKKKQRV